MGWTPWGAVGSALEDIWDVLDDVPGLDLLGDGVKALATGPLRDFARTSVGQTVLRAMATSAMAFSGGLTAGLGPYQVFAMASAASLPGLARGDAFEEALLSENLWRIEKTLEVGGGEALAASLPPQWSSALDELKARAGALLPDVPVPEAVKELAARAGLDPEEYARRLAAELGIREDMAVQAMEMAARLNLLDQSSYDILSGVKIGAPSAAGASKLAAYAARQTVTNRSLYLDLVRPQGPSFLERATAPGLQTEVSWLRLASPDAAAAPLLDRSVATPGAAGGSSWGLALLALAIAGGGAAWYASRR